MLRGVALALVALGTVALAWWIQADPRVGPRLAALDAYVVVAAPIDGAGTPLAEAVLDGPAVGTDAEGRTVLRLGRVEYDRPGGAFTGDPELGGIARRSIVRGLRAAAEGRGDSLFVAGEDEPVADGAAFSLQHLGTELRVKYAPPGERIDGPAQLQAILPWTAPNAGALLPAVLAIALAIATRRPLLSLALGVLFGAVLVRLREGAATAEALAGGALDVPARWLANRVWNPDDGLNNLWIVVFVVLMLAMVGNLVRNGGLRGLMDAVQRLAKDARSTQVATYLMGLGVFFDDYANTVLVGSTMRPLTDRFRVAREKLAYVVDSTAAPVAGLSIFSTWIAFEVSTFAAQLPAAGLASTDGYAVFLQTLPYRFYCLFTLALVALVVFSGRDFGPMLTAERRARRTGLLIREGGTPLVSSRATELEMAEHVRPAAWRALVPLLGFLFGTLFEIARRGGAFGMPADELLSIRGVTQVLYDGSGNLPLAIGSGVGFGLAALASLSAGLGLDVLRAAWNTLRSMGVALGILFAAWAISDICAALGTAPLLTALLQDAFSPALLPVVLLLLAGFTAFSTGSSWSTMGILLPLVVGLAYQLGQELPIGGLGLMVICIGAVLEGAIFGDHVSPISDTTVLSSIASASDHVDHVRTQAPYSIAALAVAIVVGYVPSAAFGLSPWIALPVGVAVLAALVLLLGRRADEPAPA